MTAKNIELELVKTKPDSSLRFHYSKASNMCSRRWWHYHPEIELVYIPQGKGKLFVSNTVKKYDGGVIILLHSNILHQSFDYGYEGEDYEEYVIQILPEYLEGATKGLPEFKDINALLEAARQGIYLPLHQKQGLFDAHFEKYATGNNFEQIILLFKVLYILSKEPYFSIEATSSVQIPPLSIERMEKVFGFIADNFADNITSRDAARLLHLTDSSFCRFFQKHTRRTFKETLNEYRLASACKLLAHTDKSIETIAYETGYGSQSFFNRMFKRENGITPLAYRKEWRPPHFTFL